ncbi:MAG: RNA polymerase sigma-70 factor [Bacteroidales bacterium]|nr:RNA polymerase sigma-70 factor [Bacteroidales bacterium]
MSDYYLLEDLVQEYQHRFLSFAYGYVKDESVAEDIVIESLAAFWVRSSSLPKDTNVPAYILTSIKNKSLNYLKRKRNELNLEDSLSDTLRWDYDFRISALQSFDPHDLFKKEIIQIVDRTLKEMPEKTRKIFNMSRMLGKKNKDIASLVGITEKGVEYHITKALQALREALRDYISFSVLFFLLQ